MRRASAVAILLLAACGGDRQTGPSSDLLTSSQFTINAESYFIYDFNVPRPGRVVTVTDWTLASNRLGAILTTPACDLAGLARESCALHGSSTTKPAEVSAQVSAGTLRLFVVSLGPDREQGVINVYLR